MTPLNHIYIPASILKLKDLNLREKLLLALAYNFDKGLRVGNSELAELLSVKPSRISEILCQLEAKEYVTIENKQSRHRAIYFRSNTEVSKELLSTINESKEPLLSDLNGSTFDQNRNIKNKESVEATEPTLSSAIVNYWNAKGNLPKIKSFTGHRQNKLKARMKESLFAENWEAIIDKISSSSFCTGSGGTGWKADIDWILENDTNYVKVFEGKYDNKPAESKPEQSKKQLKPGDVFDSQAEAKFFDDFVKKNAKTPEELDKLLGVTA